MCRYCIVCCRKSIRAIRRNSSSSLSGRHRTDSEKSTPNIQQKTLPVNIPKQKDNKAYPEDIAQNNSFPSQDMTQDGFSASTNGHKVKADDNYTQTHLKISMPVSKHTINKSLTD